MELHHLAMIALVLVAVTAPKVGRALTKRDYEKRQAKVRRQLDAWECEREVARVERQREWMPTDAPEDVSPTVALLRVMREEKIAFAAQLEK